MVLPRRSDYALQNLMIIFTLRALLQKGLVCIYSEVDFLNC